MVVSLHLPGWHREGRAAGRRVRTIEYGQRWSRAGLTPVSPLRTLHARHARPRSESTTTTSRVTKRGSEPYGHGRPWHHRARTDRRAHRPIAADALTMASGDS